MTEQPSTPELVRRIEELVRAVEALTARIETNYVRKDVYEERSGDHERRLSAMELGAVEHEKYARDTRRQAALLVAGIAIPMLLSLLFSASQFLAAQGK